MKFFSLIKSLSKPRKAEQFKTQKQFVAPPSSTTIDEQSLLTLVSEALVLVATSKTSSALEAAEFELLTLRKQLDLREAEQVLYYKRLGLPGTQILQYQSAIQTCRTSIDQGILEIKHKEFMLS